MAISHLYTPASLVCRYGAHSGHAAPAQQGGGSYYQPRRAPRSQQYEYIPSARSNAGSAAAGAGQYNRMYPSAAAAAHGIYSNAPRRRATQAPRRLPARREQICAQAS